MKTMEVLLNLDLAYEHADSPHMAIRPTNGPREADPLARAQACLIADVVPQIDEYVRQRVADNRYAPRPHAFLAGELQAWSGRPTGWVSGEMRQVFAASSKAYPVEVVRLAGYDRQGWMQLRFNPRTSRNFETADGRVMTGAKSVLSIGWLVYASGVQTRPRTEFDTWDQGQPLPERAQDLMARGAKASRVLFSTLTGG